MNLHELCGNFEKYKFLVEWIVDKTKSYSDKITYDDLIFVCGNSGIGKTYSVKYICETLNLFIEYLSSNNCHSSEQLNDYIMKFSSSSLLQTLTNNKNPKIMIVDDFDAMLSNDRTINSMLCNILSSKKIKRIPIICICSNEMMKRIGSIKNKCKILYLENPSINDIHITLKKIYPSKEITKVLFNTSKNLLQCINQVEQKDCYLFDNIDDIIDVDILYGNVYDRNKLIRVIMTDPWIIPMRFHENMIIELKNRKITIQKANKLYDTFIYNLIFHDMLMHRTYAYTHVSEIFADIIYPLLTTPLKKNTKPEIANFTKLLSFISLQKKNIKKNYTQNFPLYQINNYHINMCINYIFFK